MITSKIHRQGNVRWRELKWFQPKELKSLKADEMERLKTSIKNNNFIQPFNVWDDSGTLWILDGHHRQRAMKELSDSGVQIADELPANFIECSGRKEAAKLVLIYSSIYAKISRESMSSFVAEFDLDLSDLNMEIELPNINLDAMVNTEVSGDEEYESEIEPDDDDEATPRTEPGDLYEFGEHRLLCGDSCDPDDVSRLMDGKLATMIFTDPPYNVSIAHISVAAKSADPTYKHGNFLMASGEMTQNEFTEFLRKCFANMIASSTGGSLHFICMDWRHIEEMIVAGKQYAEFKQLIVWNKNVGGMGTFYRSKHELIFVFKNGSLPHRNNFELGQNGRYRTNVWDYDSAATFSSKHTAEDGGDLTLEEITSRYE